MYPTEVGCVAHVEVSRSQRYTCRGYNIEAVTHGLSDELAVEIEVGGPDLTRSLTDLGLIDGYRLYFSPVVLGRSKPFFAGHWPPLRLVASDLIGEDVVRLPCGATRTTNSADTAGPIWVDIGTIRNIGVRVAVLLDGPSHSARHHVRWNRELRSLLAGVPACRYPALHRTAALLRQSANRFVPGSGCPAPRVEVATSCAHHWVPVCVGSPLRDRRQPAANPWPFLPVAGRRFPNSWPLDCGAAPAVAGSEPPAGLGSDAPCAFRGPTMAQDCPVRR